MTRQDAERALSELEAFAHRDDKHSTDVQGRDLQIIYSTFSGECTYYYAREVITRKTALVLLENR